MLAMLVAHVKAETCKIIELPSYIAPLIGFGFSEYIQTLCAVSANTYCGFRNC